MPSNRTDAFTLIHDVDYMMATSSRQAAEADDRAIKGADYSGAGIATKVGLTIRKNFFKNQFWGGDPKLGKILKEHVKHDPAYIARFGALGLSDVLRSW